MKTITNIVRSLMTHIARYLNKWSHGNIKPSHITTISLLGHIPVAWALIANKPILAAILLAFFSLMDALDGALARLQYSASLQGMYFDAVSDRIKEVIVYSALAIYVNESVSTSLTWLVVAVCGTSLLVSYVKAKGEMAVSSTHADTQKLNRLFGGGIASYEIRMFLVIIGLLFGIIEGILLLLLVINSYIVITRFFAVSNYINDADKSSKND